MKIKHLYPASLLLLAHATAAEVFQVNVPGQDLPDFNPGDGVCSVVFNPQPDIASCTLRAAIMEANATPEHDVITLPSQGPYPLTIPGTNEDLAATGDLDIRTPMTIMSSPGKAIIDANGIDRVFDIHSSNVALFGLAITGGNTDGDLTGGGGILVRINTNEVLLSTLNIYGNVSAAAAAIANYGNTTLVASNVFENKATIEGPGIPMTINNSNAGTLEISNSTIYDNTTASETFVDMPAVRNGAGGMFLYNSTISGNTGIGVRHVSSVSAYLVAHNVSIVNNEGIGFVSTSNVQNLSILNSILSSNHAGNCLIDPSGSFDLDWNIYNDDTCPTDGVSDNSLHDTPPYLSTLGNYGGPTPTHRPQTRSDAIDRTNHAVCGWTESDQRLMEREVAFGTPANEHFCDTGAVELETDVIFFDQYETL